MKKTVILLVMLMVFGGYSRVMAEKETTYFRFKAKVFNDVLGKFYEAKVRLAYEDDEDPAYPFEDMLGRVGIYFDYIGGPTAYFFKTKERVNLMAAIDKYFEWNKKADLKGVKIEKTIAKVAPQVYWTLGNKWYSSYVNGTHKYSYIYTTKERKDVLSIGFFSRSKVKHELTLSCREVSAPYLSIKTEHDPETIYLEYAQVKALRANLENDAIIAAIAKIDKRKEAIDADFN